MSRTRAPLLALLCTALGVLLPGWAHVPVILYAPMQRTFRFSQLGAPGAPGMEITFYGVYLCAALCGLVGALVGVAWEKARPSQEAPLLVAWALSAFAIATTYELWSVWP